MVRTSAPRFDPAFIPLRVDGVSSSVIEASGGRHACFTVSPSPIGACSEQLRECFARLDRALGDARLTRRHVVAQTMFLRHAMNEELCRRIVADHFGAGAPVTTVVLQPPCSGAAVSLEVWATEAAVCREGPDTLSLTADGIKWVLAGNIVADGAAVHGQTRAGFEEMSRRLERAGAGVADVIRAWLYLGEITGLENDVERYRILNRSRAEYFSGVSFRRTQPARQAQGYPASTGIGATGKSLRMACLALETRREDVRAIALENPRQVSAYHYDPTYGAHAPTFSRAVALPVGGQLLVLVSGTASISDSKSMHVGDPRAQTNLTLDNIEALISSANLAAHGAPRANPTLRSLVSARVYVKRPEDYEVCRRVCEQRMPEVPLSYVIADVCRPDLLVEVEGLALAPIDPDAR
jgi:enamine deaminase RidA (YjgF/YER057c/UK114 family)